MRIIAEILKHTAMKKDQIRKKLEKNGWKITTSMNTGNLVATKQEKTVIASNYHELLKKIKS